MPQENLLMVADSERDANMLFAVGMFVPNPFIYLRVKGRCYIFMSDLEIDRARKQAPHCCVRSLTSYVQKLRKGGIKSPDCSHVVSLFLREHRLKKVLVPRNFPYGLARELRDLKIKVKIKKEPFFPERETKSGGEVRKISAALVMAEVGLSEGLLALKRSKVAKDGRLVHHNVPLTSEKLRSIINTAIIQAGGVASHTIVAGGSQGCDPHERGYGPLRVNQPIIIDVFPRSQKTGYYGDITRTVVKGRASEAVRKLYHTVAEGQKLAFHQIRQGQRCVEVHKAVQKHFENQGYKTGRHNGRMQGFFHSTGHGLGLEVHEAPRLGVASKDALRAGHVVTIEPGLYYPGVGGVRIEDVALVTSNGHKNLTKFEKVLEL